MSEISVQAAREELHEELQKTLDAEYEKKQGAVKKDYKLFLKSLIPGGVLTVIWLVFGWLRSAGIQLGILKFLSFLTASNAGLSGGFFGGTVGKALLIMCVTSATKEILLADGDKGTKFKNFFTKIKTSVLNKWLPHVTDIIGYAKNRKYTKLGTSCIAVGIGLAFYPFLTGDGSISNSMIVIVIVLTIVHKLANNSGLLTVLVHRMLKMKAFRNADKEIADELITSLASGMGLGVIVGAMKLLPFVGGFLYMAFAKVLPLLMVVGGAALLTMYRQVKEAEK